MRLRALSAGKVWQMDLGIRGRVALVTGGSRGLGRQSALSLAREGVDIAICARNKDTLASTEKELKAFGVRTAALVADLSSPGAPAQLVRDVERALGPIDILVNNVGGSLGTGGVLNSSEADFQKVFEVNVWSALRLIHLVAPAMQLRRWGRVINIASIYGREYGGSGPYMAAKASLIAITKHLALTLSKDGVTVNSVAPGSIQHPGGGWERFVNTQPKQVVDEFIARNLPMGRFGWPEPIGDTVAFLASERAGLIVGACINVDGGQSHSLF
ncbi:MAG: SDR family oxidoreductase [Chloroflexi bacterium]|nr:SDR family oxidoreductase [Chloroflexota bacterium]